MLPVALHLLLIGAALVGSMMFLLWLLHLALKNASVVDPGWAFGLAILGVFYALAGPGYAPRRWLIAAMAGIWGVRLGAKQRVPVGLASALALIRALAAVLTGTSKFTYR